jgi:hypothetical protein
MEERPLIKAEGSQPDPGERRAELDVRRKRRPRNAHDARPRRDARRRAPSPLLGIEACSPASFQTDLRPTRRSQRGLAPPVSAGSRRSVCRTRK